MARLQIGKKESFFSVSVLGPVVHSLSPLRARGCAQFELGVIGVVGPVVLGCKIEANRYLLRTGGGSRVERGTCEKIDIGRQRAPHKKKWLILSPLSGWPRLMAARLLLLPVIELSNFTVVLVLPMNAMRSYFSGAHFGVSTNLVMRNIIGSYWRKRYLIN